MSNSFMQSHNLMCNNVYTRYAKQVDILISKKGSANVILCI